MQEFALLPVWPCEDSIIAVQLRLGVHQATAQRGAFLFTACGKDDLVLGILRGLNLMAHPHLYVERRRGRPGIPLSAGRAGGKRA